MQQSNKQYPSRDQHLYHLQNDNFDVLVIGGGATGAGVLLDAASRGLKSALIESKDFGSGTSSCSTKLFHGGMRYLELAVKNLDYAQYELVKQALHERGILLKLAPHLTRSLPIAIPFHSYFGALYHWAGAQFYDKLAGKRSLGKSRWLSSGVMRNQFPKLNPSTMKGGVLFYDGQFNDSRMNLSLILTAIKFGAAAANYVESVGFEKQGGKITSVFVNDRLTGKKWDIKANCIVNATGPCADIVRRQDEPAAIPLIAASRGIHIVLDKSTISQEMGLLIPKTEDGRVLFLLPWQGQVIVGTTDVAVEDVKKPCVTRNEVDYLCNHLRKYFGLQISDGDIKAAWAGLRPLLRSSNNLPSALKLRDFKIEVSSSGLLSIAGGKWTSYRKMAENAVDLIVKQFGKISPCKTESTILVGGQNYNSNFIERIKAKYLLEDDIIDHLLCSYGDQVEEVFKLAGSGLANRIVPNYPYIGAEVAYACRYEYAIKAEDVLFRRISLAALDRRAALAALTQVVDIMSNELRWNEDKRQQALTETSQSLSTISWSEMSGASE